MHETIWGGRRLEREGWKRLPAGNVLIGEAWETEINTIAQEGPYAGKTLGMLVEELGVALLGEQAIAIFGQRFPLLAKFIDANARLSVQVHPNDNYAGHHEGGKLGKTEFWYILAAEPDATIIHGFKAPTSSLQVQRAIEQATLEELLHEEHVAAGDVIFVPAGTVHAIGSGVLLYELQEYSDITYRMYDYGRLSTAGMLRQLHIDRSLAVSDYDVSASVKVQPVLVADTDKYTDYCLIACRYFVTRKIEFKAYANLPGYMKGRTASSCVILSSLGAEVQIRYGKAFEGNETLERGQTMVLPAGLGEYSLEGSGVLMFSYVPTADDEVWRLWEEQNSALRR
ncbi:MAG: class I mannose-6-phosphate isomerase [Ktedonobacteraceae bacterium]